MNKGTVEVLHNRIRTNTEWLYKFKSELEAKKSECDNLLNTIESISLSIDSMIKDLGNHFDETLLQRQKSV